MILERELVREREGEVKLITKTHQRLKEEERTRLFSQFGIFFGIKINSQKQQKVRNKKKLQSHRKQHTHEQANEQLIPTQLNKRNVL